MDVIYSYFIKISQPEKHTFEVKILNLRELDAEFDIIIFFSAGPLCM